MVEAIAKLVEAIRDPGPRARGKTVLPGRAARRAERAADDAGEKVARDARLRARLGPLFFPRVFRGTLRAPRRAPRRDRLPCARGPGSRIAFVNFVLPFP